MKATITMGPLTIEAEGAGEDVALALNEAAEHGSQMLEAAVTLKQLALAKEVLGVQGGLGVSSPVTGSAPANDGGPPADDAPTCKHGLMKDTLGDDYKYRYYCTLKTDKGDPNAWKAKCKPQVQLKD